MDYIDLSFDALFQGRKSLPWLPWVGAGFSSSPVKTMLLGESIYEWNPVTGSAARRYAEPTGLRLTHKNCAMQFDREATYVRNVERAIFSVAKPTDSQKRRLWTSVVYHNLVLQLLESSKHRPELGQFKAGWHEALDLCDMLGIEQCLVYGVASVKALREVVAERNLQSCIRRVKQKVGNCYPYSGMVGSGERQLKLLFIRHPSSYFSWKKWGPTVRENLSLEFLKPMRTSAAPLTSLDSASSSSSSS